MQLKDLISNIDYRQIIGDTDTEITGLVYDSRKVNPGDLFFCIKGFEVDGHDFAYNAEESGAVAIVVENIQPNLSATQIVVDDSRIAMAQISSAFFGHPTRKLKLVGITGTNGKTTTSFMVEMILRSAGYKTGLIGTIEYKIGDRRFSVDRTTPESLDLQLLFSQMVESGVDIAVMEVSSHAIDQSRICACDFDVVVFTNLSQDHLDYHETIDDYFKVKKRIFDEATSRMVAQVINVDDEYGRQLIGTDKNNQLRYSIKDKVEVYGRNIELRSDGTELELCTPLGHIHISLKLPGLYNVHNALAASAVAVAHNIDLDLIKQGLEMLENVPGRFERVDCGQEFTVIVDYAHTPDSLEKVLDAGRQLTKGRLITVFGCGGNRDKGKRPLMGKIAAEKSDYVIITSDNPRSENPMQIIEAIMSGINDSERAHFKVEEDRKAAIKMALNWANVGDFVVIAGKGHETGQEIAGTKIPFDDVQVARKILREMVG